MKARSRQALGLILGILMAAGCATAPPEAAPDLRPDREASEEPAPLRVGIARTAPPIIFKQRGRTVGLEADLARALSEALGRRLQFVPVYWPDLIVELKTNHIDIIMAGMSITQERKRDVAFADPYLTIGQQMLIHSRDFHRWGSADALRSQALRIGTEESSTGERLVREEFPHARQTSYPRIAAAIEALVAGDLDGVVYDSPTARWMARRYKADGIVAVPGLLTEEQLAWAVRQDDDRLRRRINAILAQWRSDGTLDEIIERWVPRAPGERR